MMGRECSWLDPSYQRPHYRYPGRFVMPFLGVFVSENQISWRNIKHIRIQKKAKHDINKEELRTLWLGGLGIVIRALSVGSWSIFEWHPLPVDQYSSATRFRLVIFEYHPKVVGHIRVTPVGSWSIFTRHLSVAAMRTIWGWHQSPKLIHASVSTICREAMVTTFSASHGWWGSRLQYLQSNRFRQDSYWCGLCFRLGRG